MPSYCYILFSEKLNKYYVGSTTDMPRRLEDHNRGKEKFTKNGCPWVLVHAEIFTELLDARKRETSSISKKTGGIFKLLLQIVIFPNRGIVTIQFSYILKRNVKAMF